jgi:hypothetical protein
LRPAFSRIVVSQPRSRSSRIRAGGRSRAPVGADEAVLDELLGVVAVAAGPPGDREQPVLVGDHEGLERAVEVRRETGGQARVVGCMVVHHVD